MPTNSEISGVPDGYAVGDGGSVTQGTSRTTGVTLSKLNGKITTFSAALNADTSVAFTLTNTKIAANDHVIVEVIGGAAVKGAYTVQAIPAAGTCEITLHNCTPSNSADEAPVLSFVVIKGSIT